MGRQDARIGVALAAFPFAASGNWRRASDEQEAEEGNAIAQIAIAVAIDVAVLDNGKLGAAPRQRNRRRAAKKEVSEKVHRIAQVSLPIAVGVAIFDGRQSGPAVPVKGGNGFDKKYSQEKTDKKNGAGNAVHEFTLFVRVGKKFTSAQQKPFFSRNSSPFCRMFRGFQQVCDWAKD
ncbi:MAG: hypothetical protein HY717_13735 [Planctomycetes bacterium]|nr:hypothetical protein [Planctomycetota bacterium]